jgi:hypothetical protein
MQLDDANQVHGYFTALLVEKYNLFSVMFSSQLFSFANFQKPATKLLEIFIISSFTTNTENLWVVFLLGNMN